MEAGEPIVLVRVYLTESRARLRRLLGLLRDSNRLRGATVFRGIAGFGTTTPDDADLCALEDPPVVIEFFDETTSVDDTIRVIKSMVAPRHVVVFRGESK